MSAALTPSGPHRGRRRPVPWFAWGLWLLVVAVNLLTFVLFILPDDMRSAATVFGSAMATIPFLVFVTVGAMVLSRRPGNVIGWLCWTIGFAGSMSGFGSVQAARSIAADPGRRVVALVLYQLGQVLYLLPLLGLLPLLVLVFPTGRLPSRRWRPVVWAFAAGVVLYAASVLFKPGPLDHGLPANPLGVESAKGLLRFAGVTSGLLFPVFVVLVIVSLVLRFRRARGDERQQLKWFTFAAALPVVLIPTLGPLLDRVRVPFVGPVLFMSIISMIPVAIGVAVLKYRLYDIDRLISRTLVYAALTLVLGLGYAGLVLALGQLLGQDSPLVVAAATLAVAAAFQPARRRIQAAVDRRFNRRRYDAAKTIEAFSIRLRQQVDLDALTAELLGVVEQALQPTSVSLWLRPSVASRAASHPTAPSLSVRTGL